MVINIELIRSDPSLTKKLLQQRGEEIPVQEIIDMDNRRRALVSKTDDLRARRNSASKDISQKVNMSTELIEEMRSVGSEIKALDAETRILQKEINELLLTIPNIPQNDFPIGVHQKPIFESNHLIEEFMLLANKTIASFIGKVKK